MLVLSRKLDQQIVIRDDIVVTVVEIRGDKVRLGIEAPREVPVHRREIYDRIERTRALAATAVPVDTPRMTGRAPIREPAAGTISLPGIVCAVVVTECCRCGGYHPAIAARRYEEPSDEFTHWAVCPTTGEAMELRFAPPPAAE